MSVMLMPSIVQTASCGRVPFDAKFDCWPVSLPPMFTRSTSTPGTERISANGSREVGISRELVGREVGGRAGGLDVDDRRVAVDRNRLGHCRNLQRERQLDVAADRDDDVVAHHGGETLERGGDFVGPRRKIEKPVLAGGLGDERLRRVDALRRDGDAGQDAALLVLDSAVK